MATYNVAYGKRDNIEPAILSGKIPPGSIILTEDTNEIFFYDLDKSLRTYEERYKFSSLKEAESWVSKYDCKGRILSIHEDGKCNVYVVNYDNKIVKIEGSGSAVNIDGKISIWVESEVYRVNDTVLMHTCNEVTGELQACIAVCHTEHPEYTFIKKEEGFPNASIEELLAYWDIKRLYNPYEGRDKDGNLIDESYAKQITDEDDTYGLAAIITIGDDIAGIKIRNANNPFHHEVLLPRRISELENDSNFISHIVADLSEFQYPNIILVSNKTIIYGEIVPTLETLPVMIDEYTNNFEGSCVFKMGDIAYPISHEGVSMTWAGEDCSDDGYFYPQPNTTYELHCKKLGSMYSIRVGTIVTPHDTEEV